MNRVQLVLLEECTEAMALKCFSEWEEEFIESLSEKPEDYELSDKQNAALNRVNSKCNAAIKRYPHK